MDKYTDGALPELLEEAMQLIVTLIWRSPDAGGDIGQAARGTLARLYKARRDAMEIGCECCQRNLDEGDALG